MGFHGGGGGQTLPHKHTNIANDGSPLDMNNVTIGSLGAGSIAYSSGAALQELTIGAGGTVLTSTAGVPTWAAGAGGATLTKTFRTTAVTQSTTSAVFINATTFTMTCTAGAGNAICWFGTPYQNAGAADMELRYNFSVDGATTPLIFHDSAAGGAVWENAEVFGVSDTLSSQTIDLQYRSPFGGTSSIQRAGYAGIMYVLEIA